jgi:hypothetical protein
MNSRFRGLHVTSAKGSQGGSKSCLDGSRNRRDGGGKAQKRSANGRWGESCMKKRSALEEATLPGAKKRCPAPPDHRLRRRKRAERATTPLPHLGAEGAGRYHINWNLLSAMAGVTLWNFHFRLFPGTIRSRRVVELLPRLFWAAAFPVHADERELRCWLLFRLLVPGR